MFSAGFIVQIALIHGIVVIYTIYTQEGSRHGELFSGGGDKEAQAQGDEREANKSSTLNTSPSLYSRTSRVPIIWLFMHRKRSVFQKIKNCEGKVKG